MLKILRKIWRISRYSAGLSIGDGIVSKDRSLPNITRHPPINQMDEGDEEDDDAELPESQQTTIVNAEPESPAELLRQENERLRAENEFLRLMASGSLSQPKNTTRRFPLN
ncbi:hypothetical protein C0991_001793 [Blastosporella zonata]|nr:hypothetical protein C0991_001793 [Blastosporella zonata]